jgi:Fe-S cluster biogenesis protein NfuA
MGIKNPMTDAYVGEQVQQILDVIRPAIVSDGGDIQFVSYKQGVVYVQLSGACVGCPMSFYTLKLGVEDAIKKQLPFVQSVEAVE